MTSKLTRERLQEIAEDGFLKHGESKELARMALAAMDSEPVAEVVSIYGDPEAFGEREIRPLIGIQQMPYGTKLYRHAQPAPNYPETLPCPVLLEPGLRFSKGIKTSTMLAALARRAVYESDMAALSPEEIADFQTRIEEFKSLIAQQPVVPVSQKEPISFDDWSRKCALQITLCYPDFRKKAQYIWDSARETQHVAPVVLEDIALPHSWFDGEGVEVMSADEVKRACRAAMFAAAPQSPGSEPATVPVIPARLVDSVTEVLRMLDEYPERLVPVNRQSALIRELRSAVLEAASI